MKRLIASLALGGSLLGGIAVPSALGGVAVGTPVFSPAASAAAVIQPDQDVEYVSGGVTFKASYRAPAAGATGVPAAVIIGGSGDVDRNGNAPTIATEMYRWMADRLSAQGIASIRYDKLGTGATGLGPYESDPSVMLGLSYDQLRVQPARDAMAFLAHQPGVDPNRLIVIGHSEGGPVALAIENHPGNAPAPAGLALIEPGYAPLVDIVQRQFTDQIETAVQAGLITPADATTLINWMAAGKDEIRAGTPPFPDPGPVPLPGAVDRTAVWQTAILNTFYGGSDPQVLPLAKSMRTRYGKEVDEIDPVALAPAVRIPTLVTCGTKDFNTPCVLGGPPGSGVAAVAAAFSPGVAQFAVFPNTVHILRDVGAVEFTDPVDPDQIKYPFSAVAAATLDAFMASFVPAAPATSTSTSTSTTASPAVQAVVATPRFTG